MQNLPDIIFINPPNAPFTSSGILIEPIDLLGLASWTQHHGYHCGVVDMDVKCMLAEDLQKKFTVWPKYLVIVFDYHIPLHDIGANSQIHAICQLARKHNCLTILGGKAATFWNEEKLKRFEADIYIAHEMESALIEIFSGKSLSDIEGIRYMGSPLSNAPLKLSDNNLATLHNHHAHGLVNAPTMFRKLQKDGSLLRLEDTHSSRLCSNTARKEKIDLNHLPITSRSFVDLNDYIDVRTLLSSRGCNLQCTFCHVPGFWGWWRGKKAQLVADEIAQLVDNGAGKILFLDDNATVNAKRMRDISRMLVERGIETTLGCLGTIDKFNPETMESMYRGGFRWIHYGAESGDDKQLQEMGKRIDAKKIGTVVSDTQKIGFRVRTSWIMDMPNLSDEALKRTEDLIIAQGSEEIRLHFLTLRLGSILYEEMNGLETPQFIHNSKQNFNISGLASEKIEASVERILKALVAQGYVVVKNAHQFKDVTALQELSPGLKIVSLCPLRYGLGWKR